jgi:hypothetical protein
MKHQQPSLWGLSAECSTLHQCLHACVILCLCFLHVQCVRRVEQQPAWITQLCGWLLDRLMFLTQ